MRVITLAPRTASAKRIIKAHGDRWEVIKKLDFEILIQPLSEERAPSATVRQARVETAMRWINEFNDENFKVMP